MITDNLQFIKTIIFIKNIPCRKSERETLVCGSGTVPGSEHIARKCDTVNSKRNVLKITM